MERIGIRELRQHASRWLRRVEQGESFEVTDRGRPIAALTPLQSSETELARLVLAGRVRAPSISRLRTPPNEIGTGPSASEVLARLRDEDPA